MPSTDTIFLSDENRYWAVGSYVLFRSDYYTSPCTVIIPIDQIAGMDDEKIGRYVRQLVPHAERCRREEDEERDRQYNDDPCCKKKEKPKPKSGYIYVFELNKHYKIGLTTRTPEKRLDEIAKPMPVTPTILLSYWHPDIQKEERELHEKFDDVRCNGEWFKLSKEDIKYIQTRYVSVVS